METLNFARGSSFVERNGRVRGVEGGVRGALHERVGDGDGEDDMMGRSEVGGGMVFEGSRDGGGKWVLGVV